MDLSGRLRRRGLIPFFDGESLTSPKPKPRYRLPQVSVGDHLFNRRTDLGMSQRQAAEMMDVALGSLVNWETGHTGIDLSAYPKIIEFLGYNPLGESRTRGEAVRRERLARGLGLRALARLAGVSVCTLRRLESDTPSMARRWVAAVLRVLDLQTSQAPDV